MRDFPRNEDAFHCNVVYRVLRFSSSKTILRQLLSISIPTTTKGRAPASTFRNIISDTYSAVMEWGSGGVRRIFGGDGSEDADEILRRWKGTSVSVQLSKV